MGQNHNMKQLVKIFVKQLKVTPTIYIDSIRKQFFDIIQLMEPECEYIEGYKLHGLWGDGGQANVYLGSKDKDLYAIKVYFAGASKEEAFKKEVDFLGKLNFKNLINMVEYKIDGKVKLYGKDEERKPIIVLEFAEGGELFEYLSKGGRFRPEITRSVFRMLIDAIEYMDARGVAHRDLKPENILFDKNYILKVSDFGLSTQNEGHDGDGILYTRLGTEGYKPPEMELGKYSGLQADIFAAGVILFIMHTGTPPFLSTKNTDKIYKLIRDKNFTKFWTLHEKRKAPNFYPDSLKRLINAFFSADPEKRPTFESLKEDEWLCEDNAMQNDVFIEFTKRYEMMAEEDEKKQKLRHIKEDIEKEIMEEKCCMDDRDQANLFFDKYNENKEVKLESLPLSTKEKLVWTKKDPAFIIAWLYKSLQQALKEKTVWMEDTCFDIVGEEYNMEFDEKENKIKLNLFFTIDEEDVEELKLSGQLFRQKDNQVTVEWFKEEGNTFWLGSIIHHLNQALQVLV